MGLHYAVRPKAPASVAQISISRVHLQRLQGIAQDRIEFMRLMLTRAKGTKRSEIQIDITQTRSTLTALEEAINR